MKIATYRGWNVAVHPERPKGWRTVRFANCVVRALCFGRWSLARLWITERL